MTPNTLQLYLGNGQALNRRCFLNIIMFFLHFITILRHILFFTRVYCNYISIKNQFVIIS